MFKVHPLVLAAALFGAKRATMAVSAAGCFALYSSGKDYKEGDVASADITETKSETVTCSPGSSGCSASGTKVVSKEIKVRVNYRCTSAFCGNVGYAPDGLNSGLAWTKMGGECTDNGTPATVAPPAEWSEGGCPAEYELGTIYAPNAFVSAATNNGYSLVYQCTSDSASSAWCGMEGYQPGDSLYYEEVWTVQGSCDGTLSPTSSPVFVTLPDMGVCPDEWRHDDRQVAETVWRYEEGDKVASNGIVYACKGWPFSTNCGQEGYEPNSDPATPNAWKDAWTAVGYCSGSMGPTGSPTFDVLKPLIEGCPPDYSSGADYRAGDWASVTVSTVPERKIVYECKIWPYSGHCLQHAPGSTYGDLGWELKGGCDGSMAPSPAPTPYENPESEPGAEDWPCQYEKCREEVVDVPCTYNPNWPIGCPASGCDSCDTDPSTGRKTCTDCTRKAMEEVCRPAPVNSLGVVPLADIMPGDVVRIGKIRFMAKEYPNSLWARLEVYKPQVDEDGVWVDAWVRDGECKTTAKPSSSPTISSKPSSQPSEAPSGQPSWPPSEAPSQHPSSNPSEVPSAQPSAAPSGQPSSNPSEAPSGQPSSIPSQMPSSSPSGAPSSQPSSIPSQMPSSSPSEAPSGQPSSQPSEAPSCPDPSPPANIKADTTALNAALTSYGFNDVSSIKAEFESLGYTLIATPTFGAMASSMSGVAGITARGQFDYEEFNGGLCSFMALSGGFDGADAALNDHPYMLFAGFGPNGLLGSAAQIYRDIDTEIELKTLFYPSAFREFYAYIRNADGSERTESGSSGTTGARFSSNQRPGSNGYHSTSQFSYDGGVWGFRIGGSLDGNGSTSHYRLAGNPTNAYGCENLGSSSDLNANDIYWGDQTIINQGGFAFYFAIKK